MKGLFITIEGCEGSGKTTQIEFINEFLNNKGVDFISTREPGGINIAEQIREVILKKENTAMDSITEAMLYAASRRQHMVERVIPALEEDKIVICDRFVDASLVYQGYSRGIGIDEVMKINEPAVAGRMPDLTIYLDIKPEEGLKRIHANENREINRLDLEGLDFHRRVREGYLKLVEMFPNRIKTVDASGTVKEVNDAIVGIIEKLIEKNISK